MSGGIRTRISIIMFNQLFYHLSQNLQTINCVIFICLQNVTLQVQISGTTTFLMLFLRTFLQHHLTTTPSCNKVKRVEGSKEISQYLSLKMCGCLILILLKTNGIHIVDKLEMCAPNLSNWNKHNFQHLGAELMISGERLISCVIMQMSTTSIPLILKGIVWLNFLCKRLLFRAKTYWLRD